MVSSWRLGHYAKHWIMSVNCSSLCTGGIMVFIRDPRVILLQDSIKTCASLLFLVMERNIQIFGALNLCGWDAERLEKEMGMNDLPAIQVSPHTHTQTASFLGQEIPSSKFERPWPDISHAIKRWIGKENRARKFLLFFWGAIKLFSPWD